LEVEATPATLNDRRSPASPRGQLSRAVVFDRRIDGLALDLDTTIDELTFRFNRSSRSRGLLFRRLLQKAVHIDPLVLEDVGAVSDVPGRLPSHSEPPVLCGTLECVDHRGPPSASRSGLLAR
jgi:hypothetical protein